MSYNRQQTYTQTSIAATGVIQTVFTHSYVRTGVQISGTFVGTVQVEVSNNGTDWSPYGTALTAPGVVEVTQPCEQVRARCTAYTSGTIKCDMSSRST